MYAMNMIIHDPLKSVKRLAHERHERVEDLLKEFLLGSRFERKAKAL